MHWLFLTARMLSECILFVGIKCTEEFLGLLKLCIKSSESILRLYICNKKMCAQKGHYILETIPQKYLTIKISKYHEEIF